MVHRYRWHTRTRRGRMKTYHIYLEDNKCLFKNLNEEEFNIIWNKLYTSYWKDDITYEEVSENPTSVFEESSY